MKIKYIFLSLLLILPLIGFESFCTKANKENPAQTSLDKAEETGQANAPRKRKQLRGNHPGNQSMGTNQNKGRKWKTNDMVELSRNELQMTEIQTVKAVYKPLSSELSAMGKVLANQYRTAIVSYPFAARVAQIHARIGEWVKTGQKVVTLQSEEVGKAKSEFYKASADYELAEINFERQKKLFERGAGAQKNLLSMEAGLKVAEANLNAAEKKLHVLGFSEKEVKVIAATHQINPIITLFAPISGKIIKNNAILGGLVNESTEILTIMDPSLLWIDAEIYEKDIAKVRVGQQARATVPAYPGTVFKGKVTFISDVLNTETRTITLRTEVKNEGYKLKPGMFADIQILLNQQNHALVVPKEAVIDDKGEKIAFVKKDGKFFIRALKIGVSEDDSLEILSGLREGEDVVTLGNYQLKSKLYEEILKKAGVH